MGGIWSWDYDDLCTQGAEEAWNGGIADFGDPFAAVLIKQCPKYRTYAKKVRQSVKDNLGESFELYRAMSREQLEKWRYTGPEKTSSFTFDRAVAEAWGNLALNRKKNMVIVAGTFTPADVRMRGKRSESELVISQARIKPRKLRVVSESTALSGVACSDGRTDPAKWQAAKLTAKAEACRSGSRRCGTWDARMAQRAGQLYRQAGGGYCGPRTAAQRSLKKWTAEKWTTATGEKACRRVRGKIVCDRYLPAAAWKKLTPSERAATRRVKKAARDQFVPNTPAARAAGRAARSKK